MNSTTLLLEPSTVDLMGKTIADITDQMDGSKVEEVNTERGGPKTDLKHKIDAEILKCRFLDVK